MVVRGSRLWFSWLLSGAVATVNHSFCHGHGPGRILEGDQNSGMSGLE